MTYVVSEDCIKCKYTDCVEVCPVDCFHEGSNMLVIDPEACIDCTLCVAECPIGAIYAEADLPLAQKKMIGVNADFAPRWPVISEMVSPPADASEWVGVNRKLEKYFSSIPGGIELAAS